MIPEEIDRLVHAYRDGTLTPNEGRLLAQAIRSGGDLSRRILREMEFSGLLARALEKPDGEAFVRSFAERIHAEETESEFVSALERRSSFRQVRSRAPWAGWMAATLLLGAVLFLAYLTKRPAPEAPAPASPPAPDLSRAPAAPEEAAPTLSRRPSAAPPAPQKPAPDTQVIPDPSPPPLPDPVPALRSDPPPPPPGERKTGALLPDREEERQAGVLALGASRGSVFLLGGQERRRRVHEASLMAGQGLECVGPESAAVGVFGDGTRLELGPDTLIREVGEHDGSRGKRIFLARGTLQAEVARQPAETPMIIATPQGEARVLGTKLRLIVDSDPKGLTRLEVTEGKVRLVRSGGKSVEVGAGSTAFCGPGVEPASRPIHPDDIVLLPLQAKVVGDEWMLVRDRNASSGLALEVAKSLYKPTDFVEKRPSYALFTFYASAEREYRLWVRTASLPTSDRWLRDEVTVEPEHCTLSQRSGFFGTAPTTAFVFTGISSWIGYGWASGVFEPGKPEPPPLVVKFQRSGMQTLRLFTVHPSIRIDALWLSARQLTRPPARQFPPPGEK